MEAPSSDIKSIAAEREFTDLMQHGDDFFKIELWRPAKNWYKKALELNIESGRVSQKIAECEKLQTSEVKIIRILVAIAAVLALAYFIFLK
ncbi:MAG: hypothetical protein WCM93_16935 [Bacteroidota bacterium]